MSLDDHTAQQQLTPEKRRAFLRAFADRMLLKFTAMDDPEDMPGVERAVRQKPESRKAEAERAAHEEAAIKAQVSLASTLKWSDERRQALGQWWEAAQKATETRAPQTVNEISNTHQTAAKVIYTDMTDDFEAARAELVLKKRATAQSAQIPTPPLRGPPSRSG